MIGLEIEKTPYSSRYKTKRPPPKPAEIVQICHEALILKQHHADIAKWHNVSAATVSRHSSKAKKNPEFMSELYSKQDQLEQDRLGIIYAVQECMDAGSIITSTKMVQELLPAGSKGKTRPQLVREVLRDHFGQTYRKVTHLAPKQNSDRNIILRQRWAMAFLEVVKQKSRIINVDESALTYLDFRRRIWAEKGSSHGMRLPQVSPRLSLIMAIDNHGKVYASLTQVNTDATIMGLYIRELVKKLDKEDVNWRRHTLILHDGAAYAKSASFTAILKELYVPWMLSAPHSYNIAWVELLFGSIKTGVLNPNEQPAGRGNFLAIVKMVLDKIKNIPRHQRILWYHHCLGHVMRFLLFEKL